MGEEEEEEAQGSDTILDDLPADTVRFGSVARHGLLHDGLLNAGGTEHALAALADDDLPADKGRVGSLADARQFVSNITIGSPSITVV